MYETDEGKELTRVTNEDLVNLQLVDYWKSRNILPDTRCLVSEAIHIVTYFGEREYRRDMDWWMDLLITCIRHSELNFTDRWHTQTNVLIVLRSALAVSWQQI
jgi:hypothetical protein